MAIVKCPNCGSVDTAAGVGDVHHCLGCGKAFDSKGELVSGPDQETRDIIMGRLAEKESHVVGNLADLNRLGAVNAPDPKEPAFQMPPGAEDAAADSSASSKSTTAKK